MELTLPLELEAKLSRLATDRGRDAQSIAQEAIERFIDHDEWLLQQVRVGLAEADRGDLLDHNEVVAMIRSRYPV